MSHFEEKFKESLAQWLRQKDLEVYEVTSYFQEETIGGYCATCSFTEIEVHIFYRSYQDVQAKSFTYNGSLSSLMKELS